MVGTSRRSRKSAGTLFMPLPGNQESRLQELVEELPADHLARQIVQAVNRLDLSEFLASYHGQGLVAVSTRCIAPGGAQRSSKRKAADKIVISVSENRGVGERRLQRTSQAPPFLRSWPATGRGRGRLAGPGQQPAGVFALRSTSATGEGDCAKLGKCREIKPDDL